MVEWFYCYRQAGLCYGNSLWCMLFITAFVFVYCIFFVCMYMYISFFFDAIIYLVNKDAYKTFVYTFNKKNVTNNTPLNAYA